MLQVFSVITFVGIIFLGVLAGRKIKNIRDWALGGRTLGWLDVGALVAAFQMGGTTIVGIAQNGFLIGYAGAWYSITGTLAILCMALMVKRIRQKMEDDSVAAFIETRFSVTTSKVYSYSYLLMGFFYIPIQLFALCTIIQVVIPNSTLVAAAVVGLLLSVSYSALSGIQGAKTVGKLTCLVSYLFIAAGVLWILSQVGGFGTLTSQLPASYFSMTTMPWMTVIGWFITTFAAFITMQAAIQPALAAKDERNARIGVIAGAFISLPMGFLTATCGLTAKISLPDINSSNAFVASVNHFLPTPLAGIIYGAVGLIIATTLSSQVLAVGTIMKNIYVNDINKNADDKKVLLVSRSLTFVFSILTLIPIFQISQATLSNIFVILLACGTGPMAFAVASGLYWKRATKQGALWSMLSGFVAGIAWVVLGYSDMLHPIYPILLVSIVVGVVVSLATGKQVPAAE